MTQTPSIFLQNIKNRAEQPALLPKKHVSLHSFLDRSQSQAKQLSIISVHGSTSLDKLIFSHAPQENEYIRITHDLQNFHSTPRFDLIFFSPYGGRCDEVKLYEQLSYCRMLLKPGGSICFLVEENHGHELLQKIFWKKRGEAKLLIRTGFTRLRRKTMDRETVFLCATRPIKAELSAR